MDVKNKELTVDEMALITQERSMIRFIVVSVVAKMTVPMVLIWFIVL